MRTITLFLFILMQMTWAGSLMSQTSITLTFTANLNATHQPLDSIVVLNLTQSGDTVLHYPDTVLLLDHNIGIFSVYGDQQKDLVLYSSFPNPFSGKTTASFFLREQKYVTIRIFDLSGRELAVHQQILPAGEHTYVLYAGSETNCLLVVETTNERRSQQLVNMGGDGAFRIEYMGSQQPIVGFRKGKSGFPWAPGDQLQFIGYATLTGNVLASDTLSDSPAISSSYTFQLTTGTGTSYPPGFVHCDTANPTAIVDVVNPATGRTWMDRNIGASQVATSSTDTAAYGDLFQWGRFADGHHCRISATTSTLSSTDLPGHGHFIVSPYTPSDWRMPQNNNLWQGVHGVNNPCPTGYRLPTVAELDAERLSWSSNNAAGAFSSPLKLTVAGYRLGSNGTLVFDGSAGNYWSSTVSGSDSNLSFHIGSAFMGQESRSRGLSVRCINNAH